MGKKTKKMWETKSKEEKILNFFFGFSKNIIILTSISSVIGLALILTIQIRMVSFLIILLTVLTMLTYDKL